MNGMANANGTMKYKWTGPQCIHHCQSEKVLFLPLPVLLTLIRYNMTVRVRHTRRCWASTSSNALLFYFSTTSLGCSWSAICIYVIITLICLELSSMETFWSTTAIRLDIMFGFFAVDCWRCNAVLRAAFSHLSKWTAYYFDYIINKALNGEHYRTLFIMIVLPYRSTITGKRQWCTHV